MKKIITLCLMAMIAINLFAQTDVTTFLGIPVDGFKPAMKQKLIAKGFTSQNVGGEDVLVGEFNGTKVNIFIVTNNNKVCRIMVCDANNQDEANIKIRFNKLVNQFENNKRYVSLDKYTLSDQEDISYEMLVHKKTYEALFYQAPKWENVDTLALQNQVREELLAKYSEEQLANPTEEISKETQDIAMKIGMDLVFKKPVWFRICENYGQYYIAMYYDNEYNRANGEDL